MNLRRALLVLFAAVTACSSKDDGDSAPTATAEETTFEPFNLNLLGTSSPGDVWTLAITSTATSAPTFLLQGDHGTPGDLSDDIVVTGDARPSQASALLRPDASGAAAGFINDFYVLDLPGFGYVVPTDGRVITALTDDGCFIPTSGRYEFFETARGTRPDAFKDGPVLVADAAGFHLINDTTPNNGWDLTNLSCTAGRLRVGAASTPQSRVPPVDYAYVAPTPSKILGVTSSTGNIMIDFGPGFGGIMAFPENANGVDEGEAMYRRMRTRGLVGYLTHTLVEQPIGADDLDQAVARSTKEIYARVEVAMGDGLDGIMRLYNPQGTLIATTTVSFGFDAANQVNGGSAFAGLDRTPAGNSQANFQGALVRKADQMSMVMTGQWGGSSATFVRDALNIPLSAGKEEWRATLGLYLRLTPPRDCRGLQLPAVYTQNLGRQVVALRGQAVSQIDLRSDGTSLTTSQIAYEDGTFVDTSASPPFFQMSLNEGVSITTTSGRVRLYCGPDWPWNPGTDPQGATTGFSTAADTAFGFTAPGLYIVEIGPEAGGGGAGSNYIVFQVY